MGRIFLEHVNGTKLYACASCETNLTNKSELISTRFTGATGNYATVEGENSFVIAIFLRFRTCVPVQAGGESDLQWGPGSCHVDGATYGAGRDVQELQSETGLDVRVCKRRLAKVQGGQGHSGVRAHNRVGGVCRPVRRQLGDWVQGSGTSLGGEGSGTFLED